MKVNGYVEFYDERKTHAFGCKQQSWQLCLGCGAKVCGCHGTARGQCPECYRGLLTNYYKLGHQCGYKGCDKPAAAAVPRVKFACREHAVSRGGYKPGLGQGDGQGSPTAYTRYVLDRLQIHVDAVA